MNGTPVRDSEFVNKINAIHTDLMGKGLVGDAVKLSLAWGRIDRQVDTEIPIAWRDLAWIMEKGDYQILVKRERRKEELYQEIVAPLYLN